MKRIISIVLIVAALFSLCSWNFAAADSNVESAVESVADMVRELEQKSIACEPVRLDTYTGKPMTLSILPFISFTIGYLSLSWNPYAPALSKGEPVLT